MTGRAVLCGVGHRLPERVVTNAELCARLGVSEDWIVSRTGISTRRWVGPGEATSDLAVGAGRAALESAGGGPVDAVVLATSTPDHRSPATAPDVAARLGLGGVAALDVSAVCTGFLYGLATAAGFIAAGVAERVLLVAAEAFSTLLDPDDPTTLPIFGDGAGAVVLRRGDADEPGAVGPLVLGSDGERADLITVLAGGARIPLRDKAPDDGSQYFRMRGREVFRHSVERMSAAATEALRGAGWELGDVDRVVTHQANARVSAALATRLGLRRDAVTQNIAEVGNTAAASIPVLLAQAASDGTLKPGHRVLLAAFGGGLTWGATTLTWPEIETRGA
ncbi:ketoacyl-ACP synthase III [Saccharothrix mutabilis subsp. mutabilis]|uniref:Beta-ketoacyl-[acyl-carrier-protein] synthase III n=1 Tax=Saccharothrix mutabilis subsp. mutabilis TaxID=66855 RepID=A0ABN0UCG1_9PSEU